MYDMNFITERLACGAQINDAADVEQIRAAGISHIIDCQSERDDSMSGLNFGKVAILALPSISEQALRNSLLQPGFAARVPDNGDIGYLWDPTQDDGQTKPAAWFSRGIDFALGALAHPGYAVLTHCAAGINRGPSMAYAILRAQGWDGIDAIALLRAKRPQVQVRYRGDAENALVQLGWTRIMEPT